MGDFLAAGRLLRAAGQGKIPILLMPFLHAIGKGSSPYLRRTNAVPAPLHPRISGRNPRVQRRRYGVGTAMTGRIQGRKGSGSDRASPRLMPGYGAIAGGAGKGRQGRGEGGGCVLR